MATRGEVDMATVVRLAEQHGITMLEPVPVPAG
jgi:hypothetical protein